MGGVAWKTVPLVGLTWISRLVGAEQLHFFSSFVITILIIGSKLRAFDNGTGVVLVAYILLQLMLSDLGCKRGSSIGWSVAASPGPRFLPSFFCFVLRFLDGVGSMVADLFFSLLTGVVGGCCPRDGAAASTCDLGCCLCTMLT